GNKGRHKRQRHRLTTGEGEEDGEEEFYSTEE
uniref:Si:dkey-117n7.3 n=2 Tax=Cynoglossus semilaevis TaxID=244447 RepID=A0A3P8VD24_CYNSE